MYALLLKHHWTLLYHGTFLYWFDLCFVGQCYYCIWNGFWRGSILPVEQYHTTIMGNSLSPMNYCKSEHELVFGDQIGPIELLNWKNVHMRNFLKKITFSSTPNREHVLWHVSLLPTTCLCLSLLWLLQCNWKSCYIGLPLCQCLYLNLNVTTWLL